MIRDGVCVPYLQSATYFPLGLTFVKCAVTKPDELPGAPLADSEKFSVFRIRLDLNAAFLMRRH